MNKNTKKIGFIGCGKMASAIIKGVLDSNFVKNENIMASEVNEDFANAKKAELQIEVITDNKTVAKNSDIIFLATKPHFIKDVLEEISDELFEKEFTSEKLIVSIAAGVNTQTIEDIVGRDVMGFGIKVIRVMPNAPALILEGMSGIVKGKFAKDSDVEFIESLLSQIGKCIVVEEDQIDVLTAISGSGPAFFYKIINEMARAGEKLGLDYEKALLLSIQTAIGSAKMMLQSDLPAEELIQNVATKGGCTEVGVNFMNEIDTQKIFNELIQKTAQKAKGLG